jgi:hypothetical protein
LNWPAGAIKAGLIAVAFACLALPTPAAAVTATFDDLAPGAAVTNQYANLGGPGQGVTFGPLPGAGGNGFKPVVEQPPVGQPQSAPNVADFSVCDLGPGQCPEYYPPVTTGTFQSGRSQVSVRVGLEGPAVASCAGDQTFCATVTLQAYDASGNATGSPDTQTVMRGAGYHTLLSVSSPGSTIRGFKISGTTDADANEQVAIDDLTFDVPMAPPPPDFTLTPASTFLVMSQGGTITDRIDIGRSGGSSGNVQFSLSGPLPAGVSASFVPNPASGDSSDLRITADPDSGTTGFNPIELNVTGTPQSAGAGPGPRSFPVSLQVRNAFDVQAGAQGTVDLAPCLVKVPVNVTRDASFDGPVSLSVAGLAHGLQASFEPGAITFPNGARSQTAQLVVTAPGTGHAVPPTTLTVIGGAPRFAGRTATVTVAGTCPFQYDARVTSLDITQGVQSEVLAHRYTDFPASPISYSEIYGHATLRLTAPTIVRAYSNLSFGPSEGVPRIPVVLYGSYRDDIGALRALPGSPLSSITAPRLLKEGADFPPSNEITSETAVHTFVLPKEWTGKPLRISAQVLPSLGGRTGAGRPRAVRPCESDACKENDRFDIVGIPFVSARSVTVDPVQLTVDGVAQANPATVFRWAQMASPLEVRVRQYQGTIDITDIRDQKARCIAAAPALPAGDDERARCANEANDAASGRVGDWTCDHSAGGWNVGVNTSVGRGLWVKERCFGSLGTDQYALVDSNRPLSSVAHELGHLLGRPHAGKGPDVTDCGGDGEEWPPDNKGMLQSIGLTTLAGTGLNGGQFAVLASPPLTTKQWFDFMSYCADTSDNPANPILTTTAPRSLSDAWISLRNWNKILGHFKYTKAVPVPVRAARGPAVPSLNVTASVGAGGTKIRTVEPIRSGPQPASSSEYRLVGLDAAGTPVAQVAMIESPAHVDGSPPELALTGVIPSANVAGVAIVRQGATLVTRARSANPPTVSVPRAPSFGKAATLRWRASDADKDPLLATVEYSADAGRTFTGIFIGPSRGVARVARRSLPRSSNARLRVTVNDGFRTATATSNRFRSPGAAPDVRILSPLKSIRQPNDAPLALSGQAFDDRSRALRGGRLRWSIGRRTLGKGERISPARLSAGRQRLVLTARDRFGRVGRDSVSVNLTEARPLFLTLTAPASAKRRARSLRLRLASSVPATLSVNGAGGRAQRFAVGRKTRRLTLRIPRNSRKTLTLRLTLRAGKQTSTRTITVRRR